MNKEQKTKLRKILVGLDPGSKPDVLAAELKEQIKEIEGKIKDPKDYSENIETLKQAILDLHIKFLDKVKGLVSGEELLKLQVELESKIPVFEKYDDTEVRDLLATTASDLEDKFKKLRIEALSRGGSMNRQINVNSSVMSNKYTDVNFLGSLTKADNNTTKQVDITFSGAGGTPGGSDTQIQFNDNGSFGGRSVLTFNTSSSVLSLNGTTIKPNGAITISSMASQTPALNINGVDPDPTSQAIVNIETDWNKKLIFWGDVDEGYSRIEFRPDRRIGADVADVAFVVHHTLHSTAIEHKHFSLYTANAAGSPTKRWNVHYGEDKVDFDIFNCRVLIGDIDNEIALHLQTTTTGTTTVSNNPNDYSLFVDAVESNTYKGVIGVGESGGASSVNAAIGVFDDGLGGRQGWWLGTGNNSVLSEGLRIDSRQKTTFSGSVQSGIPGSITGMFQLAGLTSQSMNIQAASTAGNWTLTLPSNNGNTGEVLQTDGNGITQWASVLSSASGSFTTADLKTVTVVNGIITTIV